MENQETLTDICEELRSGEYAPLADRIEAARKREGVCRRSIKIPVEVVPTCSTAAMRDALVNLTRWAESDIRRLEHLAKRAIDNDIYGGGILQALCGAIRDGKSALAEPARECDVGSVEEQIQRYSQFCVSRKRRRVHPIHSLEWAQRPYDKEGGAA